MGATFNRAWMYLLDWLFLWTKKGAREMNNEPVAWMSPDGRFSTTEGKLFYIPLYTHLANKKVKENTDLYEKVCNCTKKLDLTDEEIRNIANEIDLESGVAQWKYDFARAILRKA